MDYIEWSSEYDDEACRLNEVMDRLKKRRRSASESEKKELSDRIAFYRRCRNECRDIARHLTDRHRGIA